ATRAYAENGNRMVDSYGKGSPIADIAMSQSIRSYDTVLAFIPSTGPEFSVEGGNISFEYNMDKLTFDWNTNNKPYLEYVPGEIQFVVKQYPEVIIEYVGDPIYVPPSANPNYVPPPTVDVKG
ncbi:MAG: DUF6470 family protein, partial [Oscillospiraceae bacterium]|nr:DUF6470 family protein [Oscillospiraceae bacterium]